MSGLNNSSPTIDDFCTAGIYYRGSPPKARHGYGLDKKGIWIPRGKAPELLNRQTPYPISFSDAPLTNKTSGVKHSAAFQATGFVVPIGSVVALRGCLRSIVELMELIPCEDSILCIVTKKDGVIFIGGDGEVLEDDQDDVETDTADAVREGFGLNFEKTMTKSVVLQDSYYTVTEMSSLLDSSTLFVTCETDACDSKGRIVELKSRVNKLDANRKTALLTKEIINRDASFDDRFLNIFYQMYFSNASVLKYGFIEHMGYGRNRKPHVKSIFTWTLKEVAQKAFKENVEETIAVDLGFVKCVIQWIMDRLASHSNWNGALVLESATEKFHLLENFKGFTSEKLQHKDPTFKLQHLDEITAELRELWSDDDDSVFSP